MNALWEQVRQGLPLTDVTLIDIHGHIGRCMVPVADLSLATHIRVMDRMGINCALVSHMYCMSWDVAAGNEQVLQAMRTYPGRLLGYVSLWPSSAQDVQRETELRLSQGFAGIKLHRMNGFPYTDHAYAPAFAFAHERCLPVLLHTWGDDGSLQEVRQLTTRYSEASIIMAHAGVLEEEKYISLALECANVYLDPTMSRTPRRLWERLVAALGTEKLLWGTDATFYAQTPHIGKVAGAMISDEAKIAILGGNAHRLLTRARIAKEH